MSVAEQIVEVDGQPVLLRPLGPDDRSRIQAAFDRLSAESRYFRFWTPLQRLDDALLERLTATDGRNHVAWAALVPDDLDDPGLGAASIWRDPEAPHRAEFSVTVADEHQARGVGTLLMAKLWIHAHTLGIRELYGEALADNNAVINWLTDLGADIRFSGGRCEFCLQIGAKAALDRIPQTYAGDLLIGWLDELSGSSAIG